MIKNLTDIEKMLGLQEGALKSGFESKEETEIQLPEIVVKTKEEHDSFLANIDKDKKAKYDEGKVNGMEMGIKELINSKSEEMGIDLENKSKNMENFISALENKFKTELGKPAEEQVKKLEGDLNAVRDSYKNLEGEYNTFKTSVTEKEKENKIDTYITQHLPKENTVIGLDELKVIFKSKYQGDQLEDGRIVFKSGGQIVKNEKTLEPIDSKQLFNEFVTPYVKKQEGGGGGGDDTGKPNASSWDKFEKEMNDKGVSSGSMDFQKEAAKRQKDGTLVL